MGEAISATSPLPQDRDHGLPKTRSGEILRGTIKKIGDGEPWSMPATIDDPTVLGEIEGAPKGHGVGVSNRGVEGNTLFCENNPMQSRIGGVFIP
jgi:hypothetical protein